MLIVWNLGIQKAYSMFINGADKFKNEPGVHFEKFMAPRGKHLTFSFISGASARARETLATEPHIYRIFETYRRQKIWL